LASVTVEEVAMRRWLGVVALLSCLSVPVWAAKPAKAKGKTKGAKVDAETPAGEGVEAVVARIEAKWGKDSRAAADARQLVSEGKAKGRWLDTAIGPVAVVEGFAVLVVTPSGKPHWWVGDPSASEKPKTPEGEALAGTGATDELLTLATSDDAASRFTAAPPWKHVPAGPGPKSGRIDLVFRFEMPMEHEDGLELVPVTKDEVLWAERNKGGYTLIDLDGDKNADRVRRLQQEFAECTLGRCDAVWYEVDKGDGKGGFTPAPVKSATPVYKKLAAETIAKLQKAETTGKCKDLRDGSYELYRYALLGGIDLAGARAEIARFEGGAKLAACRTCPDTSAMESPEDRREGEACQRGKKLFECLGKVDALSVKMIDDCWRGL
jgi:hypothetical protein